MTTDTATPENKALDLASLPAELQQVIQYEKVEPALFGMMMEIHQSSEEVVYSVWNSMPASAQNVLDNFEQFHALVTLNQAYSGIDFMQETASLKLKDMNEEQTQEYKNRLLEDLLNRCVTDIAKDLKKARLKPNLKREYQQVFAK